METSTRWALFIFTLSSNRAKENISKQDGKRSGEGMGGGSGPWRWLIAEPTGKELSCSQHSIHIYQTKAQNPNKHLSLLTVSHLIPLNVCCGSDFLSFSGRLTPALLFRRLQTPRPPSTMLSSNLLSPCFCWPAEHIKMLPTPHCPGEVRDQLDSYETIWNTHHAGEVDLRMVYM